MDNLDFGQPYAATYPQQEHNGFAVCTTSKNDLTNPLKCEWNAAYLFGRPFVKRFALCYWTVVLSVLSCLSVTLVHCGQTFGWIKMPLGREIGLGPCDIVSDGDPSPQKRAQQPPIFCSMSIVAKRSAHLSNC